MYSEYLGYNIDIHKHVKYHWRSARLVVDVDNHKFGWSRQTAIDFLMKNTGYTLDVATAQVDVYISTPGKAVAYKVGEREIQRLRKKFTKEEMNLKEFHTDVLKCNGSTEDLDSCI